MRFAMLQELIKTRLYLTVETMAYFNYHAKAKNLIADGHLKKFDIVDNWNGIKPELVLYFDNNKPMPIREYRFDEYLRNLSKE